MIVSEGAVREYLDLNASASTSKYSAGLIGSNSRAAQSFIERRTGRILENQSAATLKFSTDGRNVVFLPGIRTVTSVTWNGAELEADSTYWLLPDVQQTGVYTGLQLRPFSRYTGGPWYKAISSWWDRGLDNPFYPGSGYAPNDLVVVGDWGYATVEAIPFALVQAIKVLAAWITLRPNSLLGNVAISPEGFATTYGDLPPEVGAVITEYRVSEPLVAI